MTQDAKPVPTQSSAIRQAFLDYFATHGHTIVPSASLIPYNDPTLLFNNAGMNQFKDVFLGIEKRDYQRAVSSQKCVRAGGKHNDLDNVGYTARHHTFFEMLGNFSFGDYFKEDGIAYVWEFLTGSDYLNLDTDRLYVTVYQSDEDAYRIWHEKIGLPADRIIRIGDNKGAPYASDNFWSMGDTGPCGPCTEVFYDHGDKIAGGLPGTPEEDGDRYIEIWNCVFMQYNRLPDGTMQPLPAPSVDTGMGLERIAAIMQGVHSNYEIDIFVHLMNAAATILNIDNNNQSSLKVIADHIRSVAFLIADGVLPSNEGRGYVLRRIIRRAVRHGNKLGAQEGFFYKMVQPLIDCMGDAYPQLSNQQMTIETAIEKEESQFAKTLNQGLKLLNQALEGLNAGDVLEGEAAFKLYDTYGFPLDLTADITRERDIAIDEAGFESAMKEQKQRARAAGQFDVDYSAAISVGKPTDFSGYDRLTDTGEIVGLYVQGSPEQSVSEGDAVIVVLDKTPFYAEGGGQAGEMGEIKSDSGIIRVDNTQKSGHAIIHHGTVTMGTLSQGQAVNCQITTDIRLASARNHSATHLLHAALRQLLGDSVQQKGSLVNHHLLRFDFSYDCALDNEQLQKIEHVVNQQIMSNTPARIETMSIEQAKDRGAIALFGEKYADDVRVLTLGERHDRQPFSIELCGGIHVDRTGDIGIFKIISESSIASGIRRIEALTGQTALTYIQSGETQLNQLASHLKAKRSDVAERVFSVLDKQKEQDKQIEQLQQKLSGMQAKTLTSQVQPIGASDTPVLIAATTGYDGKSLRALIDQLKSQLENAIIVLASTHNDKTAMAAAVAPTLTNQIKAGDIIKYLAQQLGGKGGGKPDYAQGGAPYSPQLNEKMNALTQWLQEQL